MKPIPKFLLQDKDLPSSFVTEDASGGDVTPLVFTESQWDKACAVFLSVIISGLLIDFGYWFWRL